jgi:hypothetical protein
MAYIPRSSFSQAPGVIPMQVKKKHTIRVFSLLGTLLMTLSFIATAGVFFYKDYLQKQLSAAQVELDSISSSDNEKKMAEIETYDRKLSVAHNILDNHIAVSRIFTELESVTKQTVQFKSFDYLYDPGFEVEVTLTGDTQELKSVALQKMQILQDGIFSDFVVRNITAQSLVVNEDDETNKNQQNNREDDTESDLGVGFEVVGLFDIDALAYTGETESMAPAVFVPEAPAVATTSDMSEITASTSMSSNDESI